MATRPLRIGASGCENDQADSEHTVSLLDNLPEVEKVRKTHMSCCHLTDIIVPEYRRWGDGGRDNRGADNDGFNTAGLTSVTSACAPGDISGGIQCTSLEQSYFTHLGQMTKSLKFDCNWISLGYYYDFFCLFCTSHITLLLKLWLQTLSTSLQSYFEGRICPKNWQNTQ